MGRLLIGLGLVLLVAGLVVLGLERLGLPLGRLPGDLSYRGKGVRIFAPLGTSLFLSALASAILYLLARARR